MGMAGQYATGMQGGMYGTNMPGQQVNPAMFMTAMAGLNPMMPGMNPMAGANPFATNVPGMMGGMPGMGMPGMGMGMQPTGFPPNQMGGGYCQQNPMAQNLYAPQSNFMTGAMGGPGPSVESFQRDGFRILGKEPVKPKNDEG